MLEKHNKVVKRHLTKSSFKRKIRKQQFKNIMEVKYEKNNS
jgi:hypothetical protein